MADILLGFQWERQSARYRDLSTGRWTSRATVTELMEAQVSSAERRLGNLVTAAHEGRLAPGWFAETMRTELRRLHLQNAALGIGGMDRMTSREFGRVGAALREDYARVARLTQELQDGTVSIAQALNRVQGYVGSARMQFFEAERTAMAQTGRQYEERRLLHANESCGDCIDYAGRGWRPAGELPIPGTNSACKSWCRCTMERREVRVDRQAA